MDLLEAVVCFWRWLTAVWLLLVVRGGVSLTNIHVPAGHSLHHALHHFDVLHKDHLRHKHITNSHREVHFTTLDRNFRLQLFPRKQLFHRNVEVRVLGKDGERRHGIHFDQFYEGYLHDDPHSLVVANLDPDSGLLTASISTQHDRYYIEPSHHHIDVSHDYHMISYRSSDLKYNITRDPSLHFCGVGVHSSSLSHRLLPDSQLGTPSLAGPSHPSPTGPSHPSLTGPSHHHPQLQDLEKHLQTAGGVERLKQRGRLRRQTSSALNQYSCPMELVATHSFVQVYGSEGVSDVVQFLIQLIDVIDQQMFRTTNWTGDIRPRGLSIRRITVLEEPSEPGNGPIYNQLRPPGGWNSNVLLGHFSHANWSHVCLSHLFTSETFSDGRLGVAYIASPINGQSGGICSQTQRDFNGGAIATANVGISSLYDGRRLLLAEAQLITGHEIGHNWGSDHDPVEPRNVCNPPLDGGGKFLMYQSANDGTLPNNYRFSTCSQVDVGDVLNAKSSRCFELTSDMVSRCGNYEVEEDEQCDGGLEGMLDNDLCCDTQCRLRSTAVCSDVNDACCSRCQFADSSRVCKEYAPSNFQCLENINCTGTSGKCPTDSPSYVPIETSCLVDGRCYPPNSHCASGRCTIDPSTNNSSSNLTCYNLCELHNMTQCFCPGDDDCKTCCKSRDINASCRLLMIGGRERNLPDRTSCVGGLCMAGVCEPNTPDLVNRLYRLFADISIDEFVLFMRENIVHSVLFLAILVWIPGGLFIHFCIDMKVWQRFVDHADETEQERLDLNQEDDLDYHHCLSIAQDNPEVDAPKARRGLQRMASRTESVYSYEGSYGFPSPAVYDHTRVFDLESPMRPAGRGLPSIPEEQGRDLDPSRDNILAYVSMATTETQV